MGRRPPGRARGARRATPVSPRAGEDAASCSDSSSYGAGAGRRRGFGSRGGGGAPGRPRPPRTRRSGSGRAPSPTRPAAGRRGAGRARPATRRAEGALGTRTPALLRREGARPAVYLPRGRGASAPCCRRRSGLAAPRLRSALAAGRRGLELRSPPLAASYHLGHLPPSPPPQGERVPLHVCVVGVGVAARDKTHATGLRAASPPRAASSWPRAQAAGPPVPWGKPCSRPPCEPTLDGVQCGLVLPLPEGWLPTGVHVCWCVHVSVQVCGGM